MTVSNTLLNSKLNIAWQVLVRVRYFVDSKQLTLEALELELLHIYLETSCRCRKYAEPPQRCCRNSAGCGW